MDPTATLRRIIDAATEGDSEELLDAAQDLADWLNKGGFAPDDPRMPNCQCYEEPTLVATDNPRIVECESCKGGRVRP